MGCEKMSKKLDFKLEEKKAIMIIEIKDFMGEMMEKMKSEFNKKGDSYKRCGVLYLRNELYKHFYKDDYLDVANFAFMLWYLEEKEKRK